MKKSVGYVSNNVYSGVRTMDTEKAKEYMSEIKKQLDTVSWPSPYTGPSEDFWKLYMQELEKNND